MDFFSEFAEGLEALTSLKLVRAHECSENVSKMFQTVEYHIWELPSMKFVISTKNPDSIDSVCDVLVIECLTDMLYTSFAPIY